MSKTIWLLAANAALLVVLGVALTQSSCGTSGPSPECAYDGDCNGRLWPEGAACAATAGKWRCFMDFCTAECYLCESNADCTDMPWTAPCGGYYACSEGYCRMNCDRNVCGDGLCDQAGGETPESCSVDCDQPICTVPSNCLEEDWELPCEGRWDCVQSLCVEVCDYDGCGNGTCDSANGETEQTCPQDCLDGCKLPGDCFGESWDQICQGHWSCFQGTCASRCDSNGCGNGTCEGLNGENEDSCFKDCLGGPCDSVIDCLGHRWYEQCPGHWQCNPPVPPGQVATGACEAICDGVGCGDGRCDTLNGETPQACNVDCNGYSCTNSEDCSVLTLPAGCTGTWICSSQLCVPQCQ